PFWEAAGRGEEARPNERYKAAAASSPRLLLRPATERAICRQLGAGPCGQAWGADRRSERDVDGVRCAVSGVLTAALDRASGEQAFRRSPGVGPVRAVKFARSPDSPDMRR